MLNRLQVLLSNSTCAAYNERMRNLLNEVNGVMSEFTSEKFISQANTARGLLRTRTRPTFNILLLLPCLYEHSC
jgi:hypothetical protein